ncbi:Ubiquitin-like protein 4B [Fukomys damarensis]|uniref:Ubiquitin-like protein 4B n=1 Tax=Fukomys damarensis TaxID=885580 RepID=A0A091CTR3_FUKDA|nr:Ubiquitin-like protein 4B [Fukomys damarensis]
MFLIVKLFLGWKCSLKVSGKRLPDDDKRLSDYCIGPDASISVIMQPVDKAAPDKALQPQDQAQSLWRQLDRVLAKHFGPQDAKAVLLLLRQEHEGRLQRVTLEALEQLVCHLLTEQWHMELAGEMESQSACKKEEEKRGGGGEEEEEGS